MGELSLNHDQTIAVYVLIGFLVVFGPGIWRRRENAAYNLRKLVAALTGGFVMYAVFQFNPQLTPAAPYIAFITAFLLYKLRRSRKRSMRADVRRRVIAKWTASSGKKFNSRTHEIDHIVPFAKGGSHTEDNLRVIEKKANRAKGAKSPWWDVMGR